MYGPPETFWQDLEAQVAEGLRQAQRAPRLVDLVASTERALFLVSQQRHYASLAARLFAEQVAVTRVQAAWRGLKMRRWYQHYKKTEEFAARQQEYEAQMRVRCPAVPTCSSAVAGGPAGMRVACFPSHRTLCHVMRTGGDGCWSLTLSLGCRPANCLP